MSVDLDKLYKEYEATGNIKNISDTEIECVSVPWGTNANKFIEQVEGYIYSKEGTIALILTLRELAKRNGWI